jgi:chemotaxis protein CheD
MFNNFDKFDIGKKNILAIKKILWKNHLGIIKEDVGGNIPRTITIQVATGEVLVSSGTRTWML